MANVTIQLNSDGVRELLKSSGVQAECMRLASSMAASLGEDYEVFEKNYPERSGAILYPTTSKAYQDNLDNNSMLKAMGGNND